MSTSDGRTNAARPAGGGWCSRLGYSWVPVSSGVRSARAGRNGPMRRARGRRSASPWPDPTRIERPSARRPLPTPLPSTGSARPPMVPTRRERRARFRQTIARALRAGRLRSRVAADSGVRRRVSAPRPVLLVRDGARGQLHPRQMELAPRPRDGAAPRNRVPRHAPDRFCRGRSKSRSGDEPPDAAGIDIGEMSPREFIRSG
jgi:hypothetical protein